jgi:hypothetical protein
MLINTMELSSCKTDSRLADKTSRISMEPEESLPGERNLIFRLGPID